MIRNVVLFVLVALPYSLLVSPAQADTDPTPAELEHRIRELEQALSLPATENRASDELKRLERQIQILAEEIERLRIGESFVVADTAEHGLGPAASKVYRRNQGVSIGGYGEWLAQFHAGSRQDGSPAAVTDTMDDLRAIMYLGYKFNEQWLLNTEIEFEHASTSKNGEVSVEFAYLERLWREELNFRAGLLLVPMGFINELHEPTTFLGAIRPETERRIIPSTWRENGLGITGSTESLSYRLYLLNGLDGSGFSASGLRGGRQKGSKAKAEDLALTGRLDWQPAPGLTLGLSAWYGDSGQDLVDAEHRPVEVRTTIFELHAEWRWRALEVRALVARADLEDVADLNRHLGLEGSQSIGSELDGAYFQVGWDLLGSSGAGDALIPFFRLERLDTQAAVPLNWSSDPQNATDILTFGLSYKPLEQIVVKADWQIIENDASTGVNRLNLGLGYVF